jgi:hypothetical protein
MHGQKLNPGSELAKIVQVLSTAMLQQADCIAECKKPAPVLAWPANGEASMPNQMTHAGSATKHARKKNNTGIPLLNRMIRLIEALLFSRLFGFAARWAPEGEGCFAACRAVPSSSN